MFSLSWIEKSLIATFCLVPILLTVGFLGKNYQVRAEVTMLWYFFGILIGALVIMWRLNIINGSDLVPTFPLLLVALMGVVFGAISNIFLFQAISVAPNPGLPIAFVNTASVIVFVFAPLLATVLPVYFNQVRFDLYHLLGIVLTITGITIIALKR